MKLIKIGRGDGCNLRLNSPNVSSIHAELLILDDGQLIIEDKNSTNGTYVGNHRIEPGKEVQVRRGDLIRFGDVDLNWAAIPHPDRLGDVKALINIGSNYRNNMVVDDPFVSRFHAVVKIDKKNRAFIRDLSSRNGTVVNGVKIQPNKDFPIKRGDNIALGNKDITDELSLQLPKKSNVGKVVGILAAVVVLLGLIGGGLFILLGAKGCGHSAVPPTEARQCVVYVTAQYQLLAKLESSPISPEIWTSEIESTFGTSGINAGEIPYETMGYSATAFFIDREGHMGTNRHVAKPWDLKYLDTEKQEELKSAIDRFVADQQLPESVSSYEEIRAITVLAAMEPKFVLWRMVYRQAVKEQERERDLITYINSLVRQLRRSQVSIDGRLLEIKVGYPGRNYTHDDEFDRCTVIATYPSDEVDVAILQLNSKKTPENIKFVFSVDAFYTGELKPQEDKLVWIGYPRGNNWNLDEKTQSLEPQIRETMCAKVPSKYNFEFQGESVGGASGSPIYNPKTGQLVGLLWGGYAGAATYGQAVQAKYLLKLYEDEVGPVGDK